MSKSQIKGLLIYTSFALVCTSAYAQNNSSGIVWQKLVIREVAVDSKRTQEKTPAKSSAILDVLIDAIQSEKLPSYPDNSFSRKFTTSKFKKQITDSEHDTIVVTDPTTGNEVIKIIKHELDREKVNKLRILEEWSFDRAKGITNIQIIGIAPLIDVYGNDFEAVKALFWVKYADAGDIIVKHAKSYPQKALTSLLWKEYFGANTSQTPFVFNWIGRRSRMLDLDPEITKRYLLKNTSSDSSLSDIISNRIDHNEINIYDSLGTPLQRSAIYPSPDTIILVDPVTGQEVMKVIKHCLLYYSHDPKYNLIEDWNFDIRKGNTQIKITYITPFGKNSNDYDNRFPGFTYWMKFEDISSILEQYEQSHYNTSLANLLWNEYFLKEEVKTSKK